MKKEKVFIGILLILGAISLVFGQFWSFINGTLAIGITIYLLWKVFKSIMKINFGGILFPIAILCYMYKNILGIEEIGLWTMLIAAALATGGLSIIFGKFKFKRIGKAAISFGNDEERVHMGEKNIEVNFSSATKYVTSNDFEHLVAECNFGNVKIYLDNSSLSASGGVINLDINFSGAEIYVPRDWHVVNNIDVSFGGVDFKGIIEKDKITDKQNTLVLNGEANFAGVNVIYI